MRNNVCIDRMNQGFKVTQGEEHLGTYVDTMTDSGEYGIEPPFEAPTNIPLGEGLRRQFCQNCGSNMFNFTPLSVELLKKGLQQALTIRRDSATMALSASRLVCWTTSRIGNRLWSSIVFVGPSTFTRPKVLTNGMSRA